MIDPLINTLVWPSPKQYVWKPQEDITAYELAECMPMILSCITLPGCQQADALYAQLPAEAQRHWWINDGTVNASENQQ